MASGNAPSKVWLILGIVLILLALGSGYMAMTGASTMTSGAEALQNTEPSDGPATDITLTVPGTTSAELEAKSYVISLHGAPFGDTSEDGSEEDDFELPDVTWEITGPAPTTVTHNMSARMNDVVRAGEFTITEAGSYEVVATIPDGAINEYTYSIGDDSLAALGDVAGAVGGFFQMVLGGLCGGLFAVLGLIFIIVHFVKAGKAKKAA